MISSVNLTRMFFKELKQYNPTNFRTLAAGDIQSSDPAVIKAFSSVITRYFIFAEKHPELSDTETRLLYYKLKLDMIARYFSSYPDCDPTELLAFQTEIHNYIDEVRSSESTDVT